MAGNINRLSLSSIPDNISVDFLPNCDAISYRAKERGLNYFTQGYIHNINISNAGENVKIDAKCYRSMGKTIKGPSSV